MQGVLQGELWDITKTRAIYLQCESAGNILHREVQI